MNTITSESIDNILLNGHLSHSTNPIISSLDIESKKDSEQKIKAVLLKGRHNQHQVVRGNFRFITRPETDSLKAGIEERMYSHPIDQLSGKFTKSLTDTYRKATLYQNCFVTYGARNAVIVDIQREVHLFIPHPYIDLLKSIDPRHSEHYHLSSADEFPIEYISLIDFLYENELLLDTSVQNSGYNFPPTPMDYSSASLLEDAVIEVNDNINIKYLTKLLSELINLKCKQLEVRITTCLSIKKMQEIIYLLDCFDFYTICLKLSYKEGLIEYLEKEIIDKVLRINHIAVFGYSSYELREFEFCNLQLFDYAITKNKSCGSCKSEYFTVNNAHFFLSGTANSCMYSKISIGANSEVKNCPYDSEVHGVFPKDNLLDIINSEAYLVKTKITKDQVDTCKDCEFRYICTDCRVFTEDPGNLYSKPSSCNYNPYL